MCPRIVPHRYFPWSYGRQMRQTACQARYTGFYYTRFDNIDAWCSHDMMHDVATKEM